MFLKEVLDMVKVWMSFLLGASFVFNFSCSDKSDDGKKGKGFNNTADKTEFKSSLNNGEEIFTGASSLRNDFLGNEKSKKFQSLLSFAAEDDEIDLSLYECEESSRNEFDSNTYIVEVCTHNEELNHSCEGDHICRISKIVKSDGSVKTTNSYCEGSVNIIDTDEEQMPADGQESEENTEFELDESGEFENHRPVADAVSTCIEAFNQIDSLYQSAEKAFIEMKKSIDEPELMLTEGSKKEDVNIKELSKTGSYATGFELTPKEKVDGMEMNVVFKGGANDQEISLASETKMRIDYKKLFAQIGEGGILSLPEGAGGADGETGGLEGLEFPDQVTSLDSRVSINIKPKTKELSYGESFSQITKGDSSSSQKGEMSLTISGIEFKRIVQKYSMSSLQAEVKTAFSSVFEMEQIDDNTIIVKGSIKAGETDSSENSIGYKLVKSKTGCQIAVEK
jgi:hypothetical protein